MSCDRAMCSVVPAESFIGLLQGLEGMGFDAGCRPLAAASGLQLTIGALGMAVAVRRRLPYDVGLVGMSGRPDTVLRDSVFFGTALSAPVTMLIAQALATGLVASGRGRPWAIPALGVLGAAMVGGYLGETLARQRLRPSGWEIVESSLVIAGTSLSVLMAILCARCLTRPGPPRRHLLATRRVAGAERS